MVKVRRGHLDYSTAGNVDRESIRRINITVQSVSGSPGGNFGDDNNDSRRRDVPLDRAMQIADEVRREPGQHREDGVLVAD